MLIKVVFILMVLNQSIWYYSGCCTVLYPISNVVPDFVDGLMKEIESKASSLRSLKLNDLLFADDFVGLSD